jgi:hypothetical protein
MKARFSKLIPLAAICFLITTTSLSQTSASYTISGRVHDELDHDVAGVRVCAIADNSRNANCGISNAKGEFVLRVTAAGRYRLFPEKSQDGYYVQYQPFYRHPSTPIAEAVLDDSNTSSFVSVLVGPRNGVLVGKVTDAVTRRAIENTRFFLCQANDPRACWIVTAKNAEGAFKIFVSHVPFTLRARADGYEEWQGLSGSDKDTPISVVSGATMQLNLNLRRRSDTAGAALSEAEKDPSMNLPAPVQLSPADRVELDYFPRHTKLEWQPVDGAVSYTVEVDFCDGRMKGRRDCQDPQPLYIKEKPQTGIMLTSYEFDFIGAQPGRWRVWAVDNKGQQGFKSPWRTFFYLK